MNLTPCDLMPGTHIREAIDGLLHRRTPRTIPVGVFNGVVLVAYPNITADEMYAAWERELEENGERWRRSPAGIEAAKEEARRIEERARRAGEKRAFPLHAVLTAVTGRVWGDFGDLRDLADWVDAGPSDMRTKVLAYMPTIPDGIDRIPEGEWPTTSEDAPERLAAQVRRFGETVTVGKAG